VKSQFIRIALSLLITGFFALLPIDLIDIPVVKDLRAKAYDARLRLTMPGGVDPRIVIVDIDERSLAEEGRWPWPRNRLADLVDTLFDHYGIKVLGFDVVFADRDTGTALEVLDQLAAGTLKDDSRFTSQVQAMRASLEFDRLFAESLKNRPVVLGYYFQTDTTKATITGRLPQAALPVKEAGLDFLPWVHATGYGANLPELQANARGAGFFDNPLVDHDGVYRRVPLLQEYDSQLYESLPLAIIRTLFDSSPVIPVVTTRDATGLEEIRVGPLRIPVDIHSAALIPYRGARGSYPYVSVADVLAQRAPPEVLRDKIVLVGTTAPGLLDLRSTPVQNVYPGVEAHANLIAGFLDGRIKQRPGYTIAIGFLQIVVIGVLLTILLVRLSPVAGTLATLAIAGAALVLNLYAWQSANLVIPIASTLLLILTLFLFHMAYGFFVESRGKRQITRLFGQYVPPELVDEMAANPEALGLEGETREMTVLFSDVRGFTTISEGLKAQELTHLMNEMLTPMTRIIHKHRGTIDKYMGDAIMAFWGAPLADPEHARNAMLAGLEMIAEIPALQEAFAAKGWPPIRIGVGLNTGPMNVGNMGSEFRMAYTVLGDAVNLGSRLEGLTKQYGVSIMVSEFTKAKVPDFAFRELDRVRVKGKDEPVAIFEPMGPLETLDTRSKKDLELYHQSLKLYREQNWDLAEVQLLNLKNGDPERKLYQVYLERIGYFRANPPGSDWDGVFTFTTK